MTPGIFCSAGSDTWRWRCGSRCSCPGGSAGHGSGRPGAPGCGTCSPGSRRCRRGAGSPRQPRRRSSAPGRPFAEALVIGGEEAAFAAAQVLEVVQAEGADVAERAGLLALVLGAVGLAGVLDHVQVVLPGDRQDRSRSAGRPWMCTGMIALVRSVMAASSLPDPCCRCADRCPRTPGWRSGAARTRPRPGR